VKPLLTVEEVAEVLEWSPRETREWLLGFKRIEDSLLIRAPGARMWFVQAAALARILGLPQDPKLHAAVESHGRKLDDHARRLRILEHGRQPAATGDDAG
jgi:hypothetical protein